MKTLWIYYKTKDGKTEVITLEDAEMINLVWFGENE